MVWLEASGVWARMPEQEMQRVSHELKLSPKRSKLEELRLGSVLGADEGSKDGVDTATATCSICLDEVDIKDKAVFKNCMHEYHYDCISQWLARKQQCPLCKAAVVSVLHGIQSDGTYQERELPAPLALPDPHRAEIMARLAEILGVAGLLRDELYALRAERRDGGPSGRQRHQHTGRSGNTERTSTNPTQYSMRVQHHAQAITRERASRVPGLGEVNPTSIATGTMQSSSYGAERGGLIGEEERLIRWRRDIYDRMVWAVPLGSHPQPPTSLGAPVARQRRVSQWVERELQALLETTDTVVIRGFVMGLVATYGVPVPERPSRLLGTGTSQPAAGRDPVSLLRPFLGERAAQFWHELACFVTAPAYTIETYDRIVRYSRLGEDGGRDDSHQRDERRPRSSYRSRSRHRSRRSSRDISRDRRRRGRSRSRTPRRSRSPRRDDRSLAGDDNCREDVVGEHSDRWTMWQYGDPVE